jgi:magnesium chelatase accessory protein
MVLDGSIVPQQLVSINGAILPLQGPLGRMFLPAARLLVINPLVPHVFSAFARRPTMARRLLDGTGSRIDALGERCYAELISRPSHAAGALRLMASWDLEPLANELPRLQVPLLLLAGEADRTLPASHSRRVRAQVPHARLHTLPGLGHLAHEEDATAVWHHIHAAGAESRVGSDRGAGWSPPARHRA